MSKSTVIINNIRFPPTPCSRRHCLSCSEIDSRPARLLYTCRGQLRLSSANSWPGLSICWKNFREESSCCFRYFRALQYLILHCSDLQLLTRLHIIPSYIQSIDLRVSKEIYSILLAPLRHACGLPCFHKDESVVRSRNEDNVHLGAF